MHPHTVLRTQIRDIIRKWQQNQGSTVFVLTSQLSLAEDTLALPRAGKFGDLITADHKVLNEGCESRDIQWYAVVENDQWIQSYPCKTKTSHETERRLSKFLEASHEPKVLYTDNPMKFGKACEDLSWNHRTSTPHRSETNGIAERAVRRVKEDTSAVLLQSGLGERWWSNSMECYCYLRVVQDLLAEGKNFA